MDAITLCDIFPGTMVQS